MNTGIREYENPTPVKLYIQLGRSTKVLGNIKIYIHFTMAMMMMICCPSLLRFREKSRHLPYTYIYILYVYMYMCVYNYMCIYIYIIYPFMYSYHDVSLDILKQVWLIVSWYIILTHTIMSLSLRHINDEDHGQVEQCNMKPCPLARLDRATDAMLVRW